MLIQRTKSWLLATPRSKTIVQSRTTWLRAYSVRQTATVRVTPSKYVLYDCLNTNISNERVRPSLPLCRSERRCAHRH